MFHDRDDFASMQDAKSADIPAYAKDMAVSGMMVAGWDAARRVRFLDNLSQSGDVRAACGSVGISRTSAYRLRRRDHAFAQGWQAALVLARQHVEEELATRALHGVEEQIWFRGECVGTRRRHDGRLLLAHLARLDRQAEDVDAQDYAARFDEMLAVIAGTDAGDHITQLHIETPEHDRAVAEAEAGGDLDYAYAEGLLSGGGAISLPLSRAAYIWRWAESAYLAAHSKWRMAMAQHGHDGCSQALDKDSGARARADTFDMPEPDYAAFHQQMAAYWDAWQQQAFATVDHVLDIAAPSDVDSALMPNNPVSSEEPPAPGHHLASQDRLQPAQVIGAINPKGDGKAAQIEFKALRIADPGVGDPALDSVTCVTQITDQVQKPSALAGITAPKQNLCTRGGNVPAIVRL